MHYSLFSGQCGKLQPLAQVLSQGPLTEDVLTGLEGRGDEIPMLGDLDDNTNEVNIRMPRQLPAVRECQASPAPLGSLAGRLLVSSSYRNDLDSRDGLERWDVRS
jgi:hypothetical protein